MRISDWSSDVCSSDLPVAPDHVAEFLSRARGRAECGSDVGRRLAVDEAGDRRRRGADGGRQSGTAAAMADQLLDARHGGAGAGRDSRKAHGPPPSTRCLSLLDTRRKTPAAAATGNLAKIARKTATRDRKS